ncbi:hypothetical protein ABNQ39_13255 [Azospirillum sp. A26]|uniref:hypothetical protein n=1 Tax=Azospirillum sp. A26 TaxID=3160607 RepID=UPI0036724AB7
MNINLDRLAKLLGMLGSNADGEVLNAGRSASEMIKKSNLQWSDILNKPSSEDESIKNRLMLINRMIHFWPAVDQEAFSQLRERYFQGEMEYSDQRRLSYFFELASPTIGRPNSPYTVGDPGFSPGNWSNGSWK